MMLFIMESAVVNTYILYKVTQEYSGLLLIYTHFKCRMAVCLALATKWENMSCMYYLCQSRICIHKKCMEYTSSDFHFLFVNKFQALKGWKQSTDSSIAKSKVVVKDLHIGATNAMHPCDIKTAS